MKNNNDIVKVLENATDTYWMYIWIKIAFVVVLIIGFNIMTRQADERIKLQEENHKQYEIDRLKREETERNVAPIPMNLEQKQLPDGFEFAPDGSLRKEGKYWDEYTDEEKTEFKKKDAEMNKMFEKRKKNYSESDKDKRIRELEYEVEELKELLEEYMPQYNF